MGWASERLSPVGEMFVEFCAAGECGEASPALDIGAAFGMASLAALRAGAWVIGNDLDAGHLAELERRARESGLLSRLRLKPGRFPRELDFENAALGAVHASNVFHFLTGNQLREGMRAIARWLRPEGKLFVQASTPYQAPFAAFVPEFERRMQAGEKWPGWLEKVSRYSSHRQLGQMPRSIHLLDDRTLRRVVEEAGLEIERAWLFRRADLPSSLHMDGRESVGVVARNRRE